jgi:hypothetical protein
MARGQLGDSEKSGDLVEAAFVGDSGEAEIVRALLDGREIPCYLQPVGVNGPMVGVGLLPRGAQRVMVRADQADEARRVIADALGEGARSEETKTVNAEYLERASRRRRPRDYTVVGAYARAILWSVAAFALFAAVFLLLRL